MITAFAWLGYEFLIAGSARISGNGCRNINDEAELKG